MRLADRMADRNHCRVNIIAYRNEHHMAGSGYARMVDVLQGHVIATPRRMSLFQRVAAKILLPLASRSGSQWYHRKQLITELSAAGRWMRRGNQIFHFLYGENSYRYLGALKKVRADNRIVCTYHTPPEKFESVVRNRDHLHRIDAVIVFSKEQVAYFSELLGESRVHHVPHGVDVNYFSPKMDSEKNDSVVRCLFVGQHLRDFVTLAEAVGRLENKVKNLRFSIVTPSDKHHYFQDFSNVDLYSSIPDAQFTNMQTHPAHCSSHQGIRKRLQKQSTGFTITTVSAGKWLKIAATNPCSTD